MNKTTIARLIFSTYLLIIIYKFLTHSLLSQQTSPPLIYPSLNFFYWIFIYSDLQYFILNSTLFKYLIDIFLFISCILCIAKPKNNLYPLIFSVFIWLYQFIYFSIIAYQPFAIGLLFPCLPFIFKNDLKFHITFNFGRYFLCSLYFFAGISKLINGGVFNIYQLSDSIKISSADFMLFNPDNVKTKIMSFLIENHQISYVLFISAVILEMLFIIGFFTKRYDLLLFSLFFIFHFTNYIILDLPFTNHFIIVSFFIKTQHDLNTKFILK